MSKYARDRRAVARGHDNAETVRKRNRKASEKFDRWLNGQLVWKFYGDGNWHWAREPVGRELLHKGRKP